MHYSPFQVNFLYDTGSSNLTETLHYLFTASHQAEVGRETLEAICFSDAVGAQFRIILNMKEKLELLGKADGVFFQTHKLVCCMFYSIFIMSAALAA